MLWDTDVGEGAVGGKLLGFTIEVILLAPWVQGFGDYSTWVPGPQTGASTPRQDKATKHKFQKCLLR